MGFDAHCSTCAEREPRSGAMTEQPSPVDPHPRRRIAALDSEISYVDVGVLRLAGFAGGSG